MASKHPLVQVQDAASRFYSAVFAWSRQRSLQSSHGRVILSQYRATRCSSRHYATTSPRPPRPAQTTRTEDTNDTKPQYYSQLRFHKLPLMLPAKRRTIHLPADYAEYIFMECEIALRNMTRLTGTDYQFDMKSLDRESKVPRRLFFTGTEEGILEVTGRLLKLCDSIAKELKDQPRGRIEDDALFRLGRIVDASTPDRVDPPEAIRVTHMGFTPAEREALYLLTSPALKAIKHRLRLKELELVKKPQDPDQVASLRLKGNLPSIRGAWEEVVTLLSPHVDRVLQTDFKTAMRAVAAPVAVLTCCIPPDPAKPSKKSKSPESRYRGMTVSSFTAVTLTPKPIISFNIRVPSRTWDALRRSGTFNLHIPATNELGKTIAHAFTKPHTNPTQTFDELKAQHIPVVWGRSKAPQINGSGIQLRLDCRLSDITPVTVSDHVVVFAEVSNVFDRDAHVRAAHRQWAEREKKRISGEQDSAADTATVGSSGVAEEVKDDSMAPTGLVYAHGHYARVTELDKEEADEPLSAPADTADATGAYDADTTAAVGRAEATSAEDAAPAAVSSEPSTPSSTVKA